MINGNHSTMQIDVIVSLLSGRLVRERIGPAMLSAVQSQVIYIIYSLQDVSKLPSKGQYA